MNRISITLLFVLGLLSCVGAEKLSAQDFQSTTFYVVRHADRDGSNDSLTEAGIARAKQLAILMKTFRVEAIYSTDTERTQNTAKPTAEALDLDVTSYGDLTDDWFQKLKTDHAGQAVLIVGHSNTSGQIVNGLGGAGDFSLEEDEYENLFIVTTKPDGATAIKIDFGAADHSDQ
jgi:broad specificity phosphatase PhoE